MKELKINIEGCMEDVAKVLKHLEQGGFLTQKNMSSGINREGMNTTATYEVMPEDSEDRTEDRTEAELFMPKKGEVCAFCRDNSNPDIIFIATGEKYYGGSYLMGFVSIELSHKLMHPYRICTRGSKNSLSYSQEKCRPATSEEIDLLFDALSKAGYLWDPIGYMLFKDKYVPKEGEDYFTTDFDITAESPFYTVGHKWDGDSYDMGILKQGWVFRTREEAQALCDKLNEAVEGVEV